jgi:hypothetical protein
MDSATIISRPGGIVGCRIFAASQDVRVGRRDPWRFPANNCLDFPVFAPNNFASKKRKLHTEPI